MPLPMELGWDKDGLCYRHGAPTGVLSPIFGFFAVFNGVLPSTARSYLQSHTGDSPETRRRLAVVPLIAYQRYYGESPASVRRRSGEAREV